MFEFLQRLFGPPDLDRTRDQLEARLRRQSEVVEISVGELTLTSFNPGKKRSGGFNGQLEFYHSIWDGEVFFRFWGDQLQISASAAAPRLESQQLHTIKSILDYPNSIRSQVEAALVEFYRSQVYADGETDLDGKPLPKPNDKNAVRRLFHGPTIHLESSAEENRTMCFKLHFGCDWDEEHGVDVQIENWKVQNVGT